VATVPSESHKSFVYPVAVVKGLRNEALAKAFITMLTAENGLRTFKKYGFEGVQ
jgi:molybdate transport system substrate-binding protein